MCSEPRDQGPSKTQWRARQSPLSSRSKSLSAGTSSSSPAVHLARHPSLPVSSGCCVRFFMASLRGRGQCCFLQGESRHWSREEEEAALLVIKHCRGLNK